MDAMALPLYRMRGRIPWSLGYYTAKKRAIERAIERQAVLPGRNLEPGFGIALDERVVEYPWIFGHLAGSVQPKCRILDAGSILNHDFLLNKSPVRESDLTIMTLAPEKYCQWYDGFSYVYGDLRRTYFGEGVFDVVICVSTIEHIGLDNSLLYADQRHAERDEAGYLSAARELRRIIRRGGTCYISFPFGLRQNLGWYQVFDEPMVDRLIEAFNPSAHEVEYFGYSESGWQRADPLALANATVFDVHSGAGRGDDRAASSRAIACLRLTA